MLLIVVNCSMFAADCAGSPGPEFLSERSGWLFWVSVEPAWPLRTATFSQRLRTGREEIKLVQLMHKWTGLDKLGVSSVLQRPEEILKA